MQLRIPNHCTVKLPTMLYVYFFSQLCKGLCLLKRGKTVKYGNMTISSKWSATYVSSILFHSLSCISLQAKKLH